MIVSLFSHSYVKTYTSDKTNNLLIPTYMQYNQFELLNLDYL